MNATSEGHAPWSAALFSLLHPIQLAVVEAFVWTEEPLSAVALFELLEGEVPFTTVAYHVRRLAEAGVLEREAHRGLRERLYGLAR